MMWSIMLCLVGTTTAIDPITQFRKGLNPYVLYDFLDSDVAGNGNATVSVADQAAHPTVNFGSLSMGSRSSWLSGRPGVALQRETSGTISSALSSANLYQLPWTSLFQTYVIEVWFQSRAASYPGSLGSLFSLSRPVTASGTESVAGAYCNATEPHFDAFLSSGRFYYRLALNDAVFYCDYSLSASVSPSANNQEVIALYLRYNAADSSVNITKYEGTTLFTQRVSLPVQPLKWTDNTAKLLFSSSNNYGTWNYNLVSFAIYPDLTPSQIQTLFDKGLPNAKPVVPNMRRSMPETLGGTIKFCPNVVGSPRDSDCLDFTNNATQLGLNQVHSLTPSPNLAVYILTAPANGTLSQDGVNITTFPFRLNSNNTVRFTPEPDYTSWYATWVGTGVYTFVKADYTSFTYRVVDPDGVLSNDATVTLEVYPRHTPPSSSNMGVAESTIYAGRPTTWSSLDNTIILQPVNNEFIRPSATDRRCAPTDAVAMCTNRADRPSSLTTVVTIQTSPALGTLRYRSGSMLLPATPGVEIPANTWYCPNTPNCPPLWIMYYDIPLSLFNSTNESLATMTFTYTTTTTFDLQPYLNSTRYIVDTAGAIQSVNYTRRVESAPGTVTVDIKNGFYAQSGVSVVKQRNLTIIAPQAIELFAADLTIASPSPSLSLFISSLPSPNKGALFLPGSLIPITSTPQILTNSTVFYQPSLPSQAFGFESGSNYVSFEFYAISDGKTSNVARQVINVLDTNDPVTITWTPTTSIIPYKRIGNPQKWSDLAGNELRVNFTDPDIAEPSEPYYEVTLDAGSDFHIFIEDSIYTELQVGKAEGRGQRVGAGAAGAGNGIWMYIVDRDLARRSLMSLRLRPNKNTASAILTIKIKDCSFIAGLTDPKFNGADWTGIEVQRNVVLSGALEDGNVPYQGVADPTITGVIIGVASFIGVVFLICGYFILRWCWRKGKGGGASTSTSSGSAKTGSSSKAKGKGKKAKSAYLHPVEL